MCSLAPVKRSLVVLLLAWSVTSLAHAQDLPTVAEVEDERAPEETLEEPDDEGELVAGDAPDDIETDEERRIAPVPTPEPIGEDDDDFIDVSGEPPLEEGETVDEGFELPPVPDEPPIVHVRAGAGVSLFTSSIGTAQARFSQDLEVHLRELAPFYFGVGGAEIVGDLLIGQAGANLGLAAWIAQQEDFRVQGAIHFHIGAVFGAFTNFNVGGEIDLRLLVADDHLEFHVRGGFFTLGPTPAINISGGIGVAF